ncbi:MAG: FkbM family methyltransferase [Patescibacteria group bacterium]
MVLKCLRDGDVFIDIGSSSGTYALPAAIKCGESGSVIAVDPDCETVEALEYNVKLNKLINVIVLKVAMSDKDGTLMLKGYGLRGGAPRIASDITRAFEGREVEVETRSIESLVKNAEVRVPDVVKIDVEGHGKKVILGLGNVRPKHIFMEIHPTLGEDEIEITKLLNGMGYKLVGEPVKRFNEVHVHFELNSNN